MLRLYASGLTHLTMAVHVPFIKDHGTCTAAACVCARARLNGERTKIEPAFCETVGRYKLCIQHRSYET